MKGVADTTSQMVRRRCNVADKALCITRFA